MRQNMIAVCGTGNIAHAIAADLALRGFSVNLFAPARLFERMKHLAETRVIQASGVIAGTAQLNMVTDDVNKALEGVQFICFAVPAYRQEEYAQALAGHVTQFQVLTIFSGCFGSLAVAKILSEKGECPAIVDVTGPPFVARRSTTGNVNVLSRKKIGIGVFPASKGQALIGELREWFYPFEVVYGDVLECGLSLTNPTLHAGTCLVNLGNIERPDVNFYLYEQGWTPSGIKINVALDLERKEIGRILGYTICPLETFNNMPANFTWQQMYAHGHGSYSLTQICGPNSIWDRYLTEDVPYGLVPWTALGKVSGTGTTVADSIIHLVGLAHDRNWMQYGRSAEKMGITGMDMKELKDYVLG